MIKESEAQSDIYIGSESHNHPLNLSPSPPLHTTPLAKCSSPEHIRIQDYNSDRSKQKNKVGNQKSTQKSGD
jgi:hypothetical protein